MTAEELQVVIQEKVFELFKTLSVRLFHPEHFNSWELSDLNLPDLFVSQEFRSMAKRGVFLKRMTLDCPNCGATLWSREGDLETVERLFQEEGALREACNSCSCDDIYPENDTVTSYLLDPTQWPHERD